MSEAITPYPSGANSNGWARAARDALCELGRVDDIRQLGANGPLMASAGAESWFNCLFGRDALRIAADLLDDFPAVARITLLELARLQGVAMNPRSDEEPGRILHEHRDTDAASGAWNWLFPFYGAVDTTPLWITLLRAYARRWDPTFLGTPLVDRAGEQITVATALVRATHWLLRRLDGAVAGMLCARRPHPGGMINQAWMDSFDALYFANGALFDPELWRVVIEVQGYAFDALLAAADLIDHEPATSAAVVETPYELRTRATRLQAAVVRDFWLPDKGTFAIGALRLPNGALIVSTVVGSNPGQLLASRLLDAPALADHRQRLVRRLVAPDMLAGAGVRTKAITSARFHPGAYHNGSTWPFDTGLIAEGMRRHGFHAEADNLEERLLLGCQQVGGFPEFFRGEPDGSIGVNKRITDVTDPSGVPNRLEQPPQAVQGWTVTRAWRILRRRGLIDFTPANAAS